MTSCRSTGWGLRRGRDCEPSSEPETRDGPAAGVTGEDMIATSPVSANKPAAAAVMAFGKTVQTGFIRRARFETHGARERPSIIFTYVRTVDTSPAPLR